ncbi:dimethylsulfonioproprionate lyase family protein [Paracoccus sp. DMF-8]|uniref:dimethylsulfonioproprionate lyase family protein n=1 Tax=Paracoccus sp. DMF-8 TaxID=3019445 RepID=UPI0023E797E8|nr:dimethylsulfonioproprionate lyase family protein [Paracoccus sp. DMF-8]MDF3606948.1 dimethylsulfonioproprionate lyase family protein [Paracoccus sp. DMF-8]
MPRPAALQRLVDTALPAMRARAPEPAAAISLDRIEQALAQAVEGGAAPAELPVCSWLEPALNQPTGAADLDALFDALRELAPLMCWRPSGREGDTTPEFDDNHANAMLIGPGGIEHRGDVWIGLSLLAPATRYPDHQHKPEETYLVLSPGQFRNHSGPDWFTPGMGGSFYNPPNVVHAMKSADDAPLLALWALYPEREAA